ncbi:hypothetical protein WG8_3109 [Paenibacillus sp. Aloe-11]|nr:hypothetical protein WG8_3109 [Paenibacillus sp. Aloe-11]
MGLDLFVLLLVEMKLSDGKELEGTCAILACP